MSKKSPQEVRKEVNKLEGFESLFKELEKEFGANTGRPMTQHKVSSVERTTTGLKSLDKVFGGGLPKGRIIEIYGPESSGKTSICLKILAAAQAEGKVVAFIDVEHALDPLWAARLGVNIDEMLWDQPMTGEAALEVVKRLILSEKVSVIVIDSVSALVPLAETEGQIGESHMGRQARLMSQGLRILAPLAAKYGTTLIFTNQIRLKIGVMFGNPETTSGGQALRFYASIRLDVRRKKLTEGEDRVGDLVEFKAVKNKVGAPFMVGSIPLVYDKGFDTLHETVELIKEALEKRGSYYYLDGENIAQGDSQLRTWAEENPAKTEKILQGFGHFQSLED